MLKWTLASMYLFEWWLSPDICLRVALMDHICCCSVTQSYQNLCNPMDCGTLGFPVLHWLPEIIQTHVHWVSDAIQWSHPLSSSCPPAPQSFPASGSFQMNQIIASGGQSFGVSASASGEYTEDKKIVILRGMFIQLCPPGNKVCQISSWLFSLCSRLHRIAHQI